MDQERERELGALPERGRRRLGREQDEALHLLTGGTGEPERLALVERFGLAEVRRERRERDQARFGRRGEGRGEREERERVGRSERVGRQEKTSWRQWHECCRRVAVRERLGLGRRV